MRAPWHKQFKAKPATYNGLRYSTKTEADFAVYLDLLIRCGSVKWWIRQPRFHLGVPENVYVADFLVVPTAGDVYVVDVKGFQTPKFKRDVKLWHAYGPCELRIAQKRGSGDWQTTSVRPRIKGDDDAQPETPLFDAGGHP